MKKTNILAIVPYEGLKDQMTALANRRDDIDLTVYVGDMEEGYAISQSLRISDYDAVLSRGSTAENIRRSVSIPVIDITPSVLDVLRCIRLAQNFSGSFAIMSHRSITNNVEKVFELLEKPLKVFTIPDTADSNDIAKQVLEIKQQGISLLISGVRSASIARQLGMESILIPSGQESILSAFDKAVSIHQAKQQQDTVSWIYKKLLENSGIGLVVYSAEGKLRFSDLPSSPQADISLTVKLRRYVRRVLEEGELHFMRHEKDTLWRIDGVKVENAPDTLAAFSLRYGGPAFRLTGSILNSFHYEDGLEDYIPADTIGEMQQVIKTADSYAKTASPILIIGEKGTPVEEYVRYIHRHCSQPEYMLASIDCSLLEKYTFSDIMNLNESPLNDTHLNICLLNINCLSQEQQAEFIRYAEGSSLARRNRMIYTFSSRDVTNQPIYDYSVSSGWLRLHIPSLNERRQDIHSLARIYLARLNAELGLQVVGFQIEAEELLCSFSWPENNRQLERILRQSVIQSNTGLISVQTIEGIMANEQKLSVTLKEDTGLLTGTLEEINLRIVQAVLHQEKMNHVKTCERLGISRSTLWRMLNKTK